MDSPNSSKRSPQSRRNENGKRKSQNKFKASPKKKSTKSSATPDRIDRMPNVWTEFDEIERLCIPNYKFVPTIPSESKQNYPEHYDVKKYLALRSAVERRQYRNSKDLRKAIPSNPDESDWTDHAEHRLCHKQLRGYRCDNPMCSFKHEFRLPRKLRLCSEWRKGACPDGNACLYLHSEFPCRYHYLGMHSVKHDVKTCRYYHGGPLPKEYEDMFLDTIDSTKLPMFRQMYSKRVGELRGGQPGETVGDPVVVERKADTISSHESHESTEQHKQEIDGSFLTVEKSVENAEGTKVNGTEDSRQSIPGSSDTSKQIGQDCE